LAVEQILRFRAPLHQPVVFFSKGETVKSIFQYSFFGGLETAAIRGVYPYEIRQS